jgi:hypothetical protein
MRNHQNNIEYGQETMFDLPRKRENMSSNSRFEFFFNKKRENEMVVLGLIHLNGGFQLYLLPNIDKSS